MEEPNAEEKKKRGRRSVWSEQLGNGIHTTKYFPQPVWDLLDERKTKQVLNDMALSEEYRKEVWATFRDIEGRTKKT